MTRIASCLSLVVLLGCDLFPRELLDGGLDGGVVLALAESCVGEVPRIAESFDEAIVDLSGFRDDIDDLDACTGSRTPGADAFFAVSMEAGEKWHFHLRNTGAAGLDPAIYVLDSACDPRRCGPGDGIDRCGDDRDEHLTFVAPRAGVFFVGVDSRVPGPGGVYELLAVRPTCGDGVLEHSETCDDGNTEPGDGCDGQCRVELSPGARGEREPNDDFTGANAVRSSSEPLDVVGQLATECDVDIYAVQTSDGALNIEMRAVGGAPCPDDTALFELRVLSADGRDTLAVGAVEAGNGCPVLRATGLPNEALVSLSTTEDVRVFDYVLRFDRP